MSAVEDWLMEGAGASIPAPSGGRPAKAHTGRMRKIHCEACGVILYGSRAALTRSGLPVCGCGTPMVLANLRDRAKVEPDALEGELISYGRDAYNAAAVELGWERWAATAKPSRSGLAPARCQWEGGYCMKFVSGRYCPEHDPYAPTRERRLNGRPA